MRPTWCLRARAAESAPLGQRVCALGAGEGATEGQPTTLLIFNPPPCPVGMFIHGPHLLAGRRHVSCSNAWSPQGARKMGHIPEDPPLPFPFAHVVSFGSSPVILSIPPTAQPFTCTRLSPGGSRLSPGPFALLPVTSTKSLFPVALCVSINLRSNSPQGKIFPFSALSAWCTSFVALNTFTLSDHNAGSVSCSPVSAHRSPTSGGWGGSTQELSIGGNQCSWTHKPHALLSGLQWMLGLRLLQHGFPFVCPWCG